MRHSLLAMTTMSVALLLGVGTWACEPAQPTDPETNGANTPSTQAPEVVIGDGGVVAKNRDAGAVAETEEDEGAAKPTEKKDGGGGDTTPPKEEKPICKTSFSRDVLPAFDQAGCGTVLCHGTRFAPKLRIEVGDPTITYGELTTYKLGGKPYVKPLSTNIDDSAIACHLTNKCGIKMPPGGGSIPTSFATTVAAWLTCGAPKN